MRLTPVSLAPPTENPAWLKARTRAQAARVLPAFMQVPGHVHHRHLAGHRPALQGAQDWMKAGWPRRLPKVGKASTCPSTSTSNGRAHARIAGQADGRSPRPG